MPRKPIDLNKQYNPNTAYGRRKMYEQTELRKSLMSPEERANYNKNYNLLIFVAVGIAIFIIYLIGGSHAVLKWMSR